ncbi:MAG: DUF3572 domain-containing protein [Rubellimicrobium sp.]|nr:DUF3572 domain-containing protein [Rubellimicrobium sp.]
MNRDQAETVALEALAHILGDEDLGPQFLDATGIAPADLARSAGEAAVLVGVLDFLLQDDRRVLGFCRASGRAPEEPAAALGALPGGAAVHWT